MYASRVAPYFVLPRLADPLCIPSPFLSLCTQIAILVCDRVLIKIDDVYLPRLQKSKASSMATLDENNSLVLDPAGNLFEFEINLRGRDIFN